MGVLAVAQIIVLLALTIWSVGLGVTMAVRPTQRCYEMLHPASWATVFASVSAILSGLCAVTLRLAQGPSTAYPAGHAWAGVSEALVPGIFGLGLLAIAWALAAVGLRRME